VLHRSVILLLPLTLVGCYDFEGALGTIGFDSDLVLAPNHEWTPDQPIASGTTATFRAMGMLDVDDQIAVEARVEGRRLEVVAQSENAITVAGARNAAGEVWFEGTATDWFAIAFSPIHSARLMDASTLENDRIDGAGVAVLAGSTHTLLPLLVDRHGRTLGWRADDLEITADGGISAWAEDGSVVVAADTHPGDSGYVHLSYLGHHIDTVPITVASLEDVTELTLHTTSTPTFSCDEDGDHCGFLGGVTLNVTAAAWIDDDTRLLGIEPDIAWSRELETELGPDRTDMVAVSIDDGSDELTITADLGDQTAVLDVQVRPQSMLRDVRTKLGASGPDWDRIGR
jgi:hypothetical protein